MIKYQSGHPIIIGLAGKAGSGKTSVAEYLVPKGCIQTTTGNIKWDHIFYALPLYEMASIKKNIKGEKEQSRKLFALHEVIYDIYGNSSLGNIPDYDKFIQLVHDINNLPIETEGVKPRTFLQKAGDMCRSFDVNCFTSWAINRAKKIYRNTTMNSENLIDVINDNVVAILISDVRYLIEANSILQQPNGFVVYFDATQETLNKRLIKRDGKLMAEDEMIHSSERQVEQIKDVASAIMDTNNLDLDQQILQTVQIINKIKEGTNA